MCKYKSYVQQINDLAEFWPKKQETSVAVRL